MLKNKKNIIKFEKDNSFAIRVIGLTLPSFIIFLFLSIYDKINSVVAISSLLGITIFNIIILFPLSLEMQKIKRYIRKLISEDKVEENLQVRESETKELMEAINKAHRFWAEKNNIIKAKSISDAAVLDSLPDPLIVIDNHGTIIGANLAAYQIFGKKIMHICIDNLFDSNSFINAVNRVLKLESQSENLLFYVDKPYMRKFYAHIKLLPYQSVSSIQIVIGFYDFTKALKIEKMQSDFVANASHELKTPLSIISSVVETIQTSAKDDEQAREQFMEIIATQTEYMSQLIERLLSLSKIELMENEEPKEKVNLPDVVTSVKKSFAIKAKNNSMNIKTIKAKDIYPIKADEQQIKQIIQNLIDNAIKYGEKNTTITIRIYNVDKIPPSQVVNVANSKGVVFSINNKSAKIPPEKLARLTERFYRLQENENYKIKGTGLGLAIVKHIVIRHRGNITVNSNGNDGTTFMVYLPVFEGK